MGIFHTKDTIAQNLKNALVDNFDYKAAEPLINSDSYLQTSIEHVYKRIIIKQGMPCCRCL